LVFLPSIVSLYLDVMMLAAAKGTELELIADGVDEIKALEALIAHRFDEAE